MTLPQRRESLRTPSLRPHITGHDTSASTKSNRTNADHYSTTPPAKSIISIYEGYFIHAPNFYLREVDALISSLPPSFTIAPKFGSLAIEISRHRSRRTVTYDLDSNCPLNSFSLDFEFSNAISQFQNTSHPDIHSEAEQFDKNKQQNNEFKSDFDNDHGEECIWGTDPNSDDEVSIPVQLFEPELSSEELDPAISNATDIEVCSSECNPSTKKKKERKKHKKKAKKKNEKKEPKKHKMTLETIDATVNASKSPATSVEIPLPVVSPTLIADTDLPTTLHKETLMRESSHSIYTQEEVDTMLDMARYQYVESFREYFIDSLAGKLDLCSVHTCKDKNYTLDDDIVDAYESITVRNWLDWIT